MQVQAQNEKAAQQEQSSSHQITLVVICDKLRWHAGM